MNDEDKTRQQLINELGELRQRVSDLEAECLRARQAEKKYCLDITDRNQATEALHSALARLKALINATPDIVFFKDREGRYLIVNQAYEKFVALPQKDIMGRTVSDVLPADLIEQALAGDEEVLRTKTMVRVEQSTAGVDGDSRWYDTIKFPIIDEGGLVIGIGGITREITDRKRAEDELKVLEKSRRLLLDESPLGIIIVQDCSVAYVNPALAHMFGIESPDAVTGLPVDRFVAPEQREMILRRHADRLAGRPAPLYYEMKALKLDGETIDLGMWPRMTTYLGTPAILAFMADISESKALRAQLFQSQKMEAVGTLASGVAHDFNNLLTIVLGYAELLLGDRNESEPDYTDLQRIIQAAQSGAELVQRMLTVSKKGLLEPVALNLNDRIDQVKRLLSRSLPKMVEIQLHLTDEPAFINADPSQIDQVLINLAINAKEAMPDGGRLTFETKNTVLGDGFCRVHHGAVQAFTLCLLFATPVAAWISRRYNACSSPFLPRRSGIRGKEPAWDCPWCKALWNSTAAASPVPANPVKDPPSMSIFPRSKSRNKSRRLRRNQSPKAVGKPFSWWTMKKW
jgi:two-component system, cell cycle sensor histidine kinase and response regulator CckA